MDTLAWLPKRRLQSAERRERDWLFTFDGQAALGLECLLRLLEAGRIRVTSEDDGQRFGLPAPIVAAEEVSRCLVGASVASVSLCDGTLDLELPFDTGHALEVLPTSAGYEAWQIIHRGKHFIAVGGGDLAIYPAETLQRRRREGPGGAPSADLAPPLGLARRVYARVAFPVEVIHWIGGRS